MDTVKPLTIGRFEVLKRLGRGLQGTVYLARDPTLERLVAIKLIHQEWQTNTGEDGVPLEARNLGKLRHPNIVSIHDAGIYKEKAFLVFEYVEGTTLKELLAGRDTLPLGRGVELMTQIIDGIACAHAQGILHLDLSPNNIMIDRLGVPRIMDFGLSKLAGSAEETGREILGTLRYVSPEHLTEGGKRDARTDVYALGLIFYEVITGESVVQQRRNDRIVREILNKPVDQEPLDACGADEALKAIILTALAKKPDERFANGVAMKTALEARRGEVTEPATHGTVDFLLRRMKRKSDFPALSRTLSEIYRLTSAESKTSAKQLANVILRDYAVTNKLLKLANSAFYANYSGSVKSVSDAIRILGLDQIRMACNTLTFFNHMQGKDEMPELQDALVSSFVAGLIARHLARKLGLGDAEEAFICGMFHDVGRSLTIYYFPDEYADIKEAIATEGVGPEAAAREVLGIGFSELGIAVAREWKFPEVILESMRAVEPGVVPKGMSTPDKLRQLAAFANELCAMAQGTEPADKEMRLLGFADRFGEAIPIPAPLLGRLVASAVEKLREFSPALGIRPDKVPFVQRVTAWLGEDAVGGETATGSAEEAQPGEEQSAAPAPVAEAVAGVPAHVAALARAAAKVETAAMRPRGFSGWFRRRFAWFTG